MPKVTQLVNGRQHDLDPRLADTGPDFNLVNLFSSLTHISFPTMRQGKRHRGHRLNIYWGKGQGYHDH